MTSSESTNILRGGIIGCGALGLVHARRLQGLPGVQIVAVSDPDAAAMQRVADALAAESTGAPVKTFADYRDLLTQSELDFACINSPNRWHVEQLLASLEHGLHVLCEKPLSMVPAEVQRVVEATQKSGRLVAIAYQSRYRRDARILRRALYSGKWGRVTSVSIFSCEDWITPNVGTWRHDPERCPGGFFADANGHQLDLLFWLTGLEAMWVRATTETRGTPVPMTTWGESRLRVQSPQIATQPLPQEIASHVPVEGIPFTFTFVGDAHHWSEEFRITTERADFVIRNTRLLFTDGSGPLGPFPESEIDPAVAGLPDLPDTAFIAALRGGPPIVTPPETVWPVLRFTLAALDSATSEGRPQSIDAGP
ncbi:MAG TPA: Gfo/Idh/MocA family oxidoreductase [Chthonomonadaceae bacterium]|nr:Gfo/Idh/MocA family oxidoreductase [Chthonomonadaceae bacterium]